MESFARFADDDSGYMSAEQLRTVCSAGPPFDSPDSMSNKFASAQIITNLEEKLSEEEVQQFVAVRAYSVLPDERS